MNHLAHALLAGNDDGLRLGGMLGDFVRGPTASLPFPPSMLRGIRLHRAIDVHTDAHPDVLAAKALLAPPYRRFAGLLLDMWFDHCLARDFLHWSTQPLGEFSEQLRALLHEHHDELPSSLQRFVLYMDANNLPAGYADPALLGRALTGLGQRLTRANPLASAMPVLVQWEAELQGCFAAFFPELQGFARERVNARGGLTLCSLPCKAGEGRGGVPLLIFSHAGAPHPILSPQGEGVNENAARKAAYGESLLDQANYLA